MTSKLTGEGAKGVKKSIDIFIYKEWHLSWEMKTNVVQHVESEWMRNCESERVKSGSELLSDIQTFLAGNQLFEL